MSVVTMFGFVIKNLPTTIRHSERSEQPFTYRQQRQPNKFYVRNTHDKRPVVHVSVAWLGQLYSPPKLGDRLSASKPQR
jgi:hypothetical protein